MANRIDELRAEHKRKMAEQRAAHKAELARIKAESDAKIAAMQAEEKRLRDESAARRKALEDKVNRLEKELKETTDTNKKAEKILGKLDRDTDKSLTDADVAKAEAKAQRDLKKLFDAEPPKPAAPKPQPTKIINDYSVPPGNGFKSLQPNVKLENGVPVFIKPLTTDDLSGFDPNNKLDIAKLNDILASRGLGDPRQLRGAAAEFLQRHNIQPGDPQWDIEMERLTNGAASRRVALGEARRAAEREQAIRAARGNMNQNFVRVAEGDDPCEECEPLNGEEGTLEELGKDNMLPGDRCLGGNACLCVLIAVDKSF